MISQTLQKLRSLHLHVPPDNLLQEESQAREIPIKTNIFTVNVVEVLATYRIVHPKHGYVRSTKPAEGGRLCSSWRRRIRGGGGRYQRKLRNISQAAHQTVGTLSVVHVSTSAEGNVTPPPNVRIFCPLVSRVFML